VKNKNIFEYFNHKRLPLFWAAAIAAIVSPWIIDFPGMSGESGAEEICEVRSIYDGDTMTVKCRGERMKVRLYCIDAPEMKQRPWGKESRDYLLAITPKTVRILPKTKDRYGRTVAEVWTHDGDDIQENLNLAMVWAGRAVVYKNYCGEKIYFTAEANARRVKSGVWEKAGEQQNPWGWRKK